MEAEKRMLFAKDSFVADCAIFMEIYIQLVTPFSFVKKHSDTPNFQFYHCHMPCLNKGVSQESNTLLKNA